MRDAPRYTVKELSDRGLIRVEDGNHGEYRPRKDEFVESGVAFIRAADLGDEGIDFASASMINDDALARITKGIGQPGDVILSHKGTVGKVAIAPSDAPPFVCSPQTTFWRSLDESILDQDFLYTFIRSPDFRAQLDSRSGETDMAGYVSLTAQRTFWVPLPPIDVQREIVSCVSAIDKKLALNQRMNEILELMARAIFKDWFVDFGPTRAKMEGSAPYLAPQLWALFPDRLDQSEHGEVPSGWHYRLLSDLTTEMRRGLSPTYVEAGGVCVVNQRCIRNQKVSLDASRRHDHTARSVDGRELQLGDILVNSTGVGTLGRVGQLWALGETTVADGHVTVVRANDAISNIYLGQNLIARESEIEALGEGSTGQTELSRAQLGKLVVLVPSEAVLTAFNEVVGSFVNRAIANDEESQTLVCTRDFLLPKLMSGEVHVRQAQRIADTAA